MQRTTTFPINEETARLWGRTFEQDGMRCLSWTASGFTIAFEGTTVEAEWWADKPDDETYRPYVSVIVDGAVDEAARRTLALDHDGWYTLVEGLGAGPHTLTVVKRSGGGESYCGVKAIALPDGRLLPPPDWRARHTIEFVGDSITCGFGNRAPAADAPYRTKDEDGLHTYAALAARELDAAFQVIALSGWAIYHSPYGGAIPPIYPAVDGLHGHPEAWDFHRFSPELVVINLGTNDASWMRDYSVMGPEDMAERFKKHFVLFLHTVREKNPGAAIACAAGMLTDEITAAVREVVERAAAEGLDRIFYVELPGAKAFGAGHPAASAHEEAAVVLAAAIREQLGW